MEYRHLPNLISTYFVILAKSRETRSCISFHFAIKGEQWLHSKMSACGIPRMSWAGQPQLAGDLANIFLYLSSLSFLIQDHFTLHWQGDSVVSSVEVTGLGERETVTVYLLCGGWQITLTLILPPHLTSSTDCTALHQHSDSYHYPHYSLHPGMHLETIRNIFSSQISYSRPE